MTLFSLRDDVTPDPPFREQIGSMLRTLLASEEFATAILEPDLTSDLDDELPPSVQDARLVLKHSSAQFKRGFLQSKSPHVTVPNIHEIEREAFCEFAPWSIDAEVLDASVDRRQPLIYILDGCDHVELVVDESLMERLGDGIAALLVAST